MPTWRLFKYLLFIYDETFYIFEAQIGVMENEMKNIKKRKSNRNDGRKHTAWIKSIWEINYRKSRIRNELNMVELISFYFIFSNQALFFSIYICVCVGIVSINFVISCFSFNYSFKRRLNHEFLLDFLLFFKMYICMYIQAMHINLKCCFRIHNDLV